MTDVIKYAEELAAKYKYKKPPDNVDLVSVSKYLEKINGFGDSEHRDTLIGGRPFCKDYERVVIGSYGAFVEISHENLLLPLEIPEDKKWRYDELYLKRRQMKIKYRELSYAGIPVFLQVDTVEYADYKKGMYYVNVTYFDVPVAPADIVTSSSVIEVLEAQLQNTSVFTHTDSECAENFVSVLKETFIDKVNVAIVGDGDISDASQVSRCISMAVRMFGRKENIRLVTGEFEGVESIVRKYARKNGFEIDIYPVIEKPEWVVTGLTNRQERDRRMLNAAHCVIVINKLGSKQGDFMYTSAIDAGRFVTKRIVRDC